MLITGLMLGVTTYIAVKSYQKHKKKRGGLQNLTTQQIQENSSALNLWNEFETEKQANQHLALMLTAMGLSLGGIFFYSPLGVLSIPIVFYGMRKLYYRAYKAFIEQGKVTVSTLTGIVFIGSTIQGYYFLNSLAGVLYNFSCKLLLRIRHDSSADLIDVFEQYPRYAWILLENDTEVKVPFEQVVVGDIVIAQTGEVIPVDGTIIKGIAAIDQHILTGESQPVDKKKGEQVSALTVVLTGKIYILVEKTGEETTVAQIAKILNHTVDYKANMQLQAEEIADNTVLPTMMLGVSVFPILGSIGTLATLNSHPKFKMSLLAPIGMMKFLKVAMQEEILIKDGRSLDLLSLVDTVVFDKTGTLTEEQPHVGRIYVYDNYNENELLTYAAVAERKQTHPIAKAILQEAEKRQLSIPEITETEYKIGYGMKLQVGTHTIRVGSVRFIEMEEITISIPIKETITLSHNQGHSVILITVNDEVVGAIELHATIRPEAKQVIEELRQHNIKSIYIISGDHEIPTRKLAEELGIDQYVAETLPESKAEIIEQLQAEGKFICYVGDGINDAIAMKKAQVSVSISGASTVAQETAQIILMGSNLNKLGRMFDLAQLFRAKMQSTHITVLIPCVICMGGIFLLHFGFAHTVLFEQISLFGGLSRVVAKQKISSSTTDAVSKGD
jgi:heavy metal translocating P-type ATPase